MGITHSCIQLLPSKFLSTNIFSTNYVPGTALSHLHVLAHSSSQTSWWDHCYYPLLHTDEGTGSNNKCELYPTLELFSMSNLFFPTESQVLKCWGARLRTFGKLFCYLTNKSEFSQVFTGLGVNVMDRYPPLDFLRTAFPPGWDLHLLLFSPHKGQSCPYIFLIFHQDPSFYK